MYNNNRHHVVAGRRYGSEWEESVRRRVFAANVGDIIAHNVRYLLGNESYYMDINHFSDLVSDSQVSFFFKRTLNKEV